MLLQWIGVEIHMSFKEHEFLMQAVHLLKGMAKLICLVPYVVLKSLKLHRCLRKC